MKVQLERARREPISWNESVEVDPQELEREDVLELGPVTWRGRVTKSDPGFHLHAHAEYEQTLACHRCLGPVPEPVEADVDLVLLVDAPQPMEGEHELEEEDLGLVHVEGREYDTLPLLLEQIQLAVPMKPLCREDCKGLCPHCGADRNEGDCDCEDDWVDPRWAALETLKSGS